MTPEHKAAIAAGKQRAKEARMAQYIEEFGEQETVALKKTPMTPEHKQAIIEGGRRAKEERERLKVEHNAGTSVSVVYHPYDGDPHTTVWNGVKFRANLPVELNRGNPAHFVEQLLPHTYSGTNGEVLTKHKPSMVFMGDVAKGNPSFEVDGVQAKRRIAVGKVPPAGVDWNTEHHTEVSGSMQMDEVA